MGSYTSRRRFVRGVGVAGLALVAGCGRLPWQAQVPSPQVYRVGYISPSFPALVAPNIEGFRQGMNDYGYVQGQNLVIEPRFAEGSAERLPTLMDELLRLPVDVLVVSGGPTVRAGLDATSAIPIVVASAGDLVEQRLVVSLERPSGNVTGTSVPVAGLSGKRLQLLKEAVPGVWRVAVPWNRESPSLAVAFADTQRAAEVLGVELLSLDVSGPSPDFAAAFGTAVAERADALLALNDSTIVASRSRVIALATRYQLPSVFAAPAFVTEGGLMAYGANDAAMARPAAYFVDRILKGAKPSDLPVEQPREFDFVINLKTAQALGLTIPQQVLLQATEVIQ